MMPVHSALLKVLACPMCMGELIVSERDAACASCGAQYPRGKDGQLDLRLRGTRRYPVEFQIGDASSAPRVGPISANPQATIDFRSIPIPPLLRRGNRLTRELLSYFPRAQNGGTMLDMGCGDGPFRQICSHTNLDYVGIDYDGTSPLLGDAHALPFKNESFDFIISFAVFEHIRNPFVAIREVCRTLKPGGVFIGTVAFLEPFHLNSYYHHTHLGTHHLLTDGGLEVQHLEANVEWTGLRAQSWMSLFPHSPTWLSRLLVLPVEWLHRLWWKLGHLLQRRPATSDQVRHISNTAGFRFVCTKPATPKGD